MLPSEPTQQDRLALYRPLADPSPALTRMIPSDYGTPKPPQQRKILLYRPLSPLGPAVTGLTRMMSSDYGVSLSTGTPSYGPLDLAVTMPTRMISVGYGSSWPKPHTSPYGLALYQPHAPGDLAAPALDPLSLFLISTSDGALSSTLVYIPLHLFRSVASFQAFLVALSGPDEHSRSSRRRRRVPNRRAVVVALTLMDESTTEPAPSPVPTSAPAPGPATVSDAQSPTQCSLADDAQ